jgi:hypothetical protein
MNADNLKTINLSLLRLLLPKLEELNQDVTTIRTQTTSDGKKEKKKSFNQAIEEIFKSKVITKKEIQFVCDGKTTSFPLADHFIEVDEDSESVQKYHLKEFLQPFDFKTDKSILDHQKSPQKKFRVMSLVSDDDVFVDGLCIAAILDTRSDSVIKKFQSHPQKAQHFMANLCHFAVNIKSLIHLCLLEDQEKKIVFNNERFTIAETYDFEDGHQHVFCGVYDIPIFDTHFKLLNIEKVADIKSLKPHAPLSQIKQDFLKSLLPQHPFNRTFALSTAFGLNQQHSNQLITPQQSHFIAPQPSHQFIPPKQSPYIPPQPSQIIPPSHF